MKEYKEAEWSAAAQFDNDLDALDAAYAERFGEGTNICEEGWNLLSASKYFGIVMILASRFRGRKICMQVSLSFQQKGFGWVNGSEWYDRTN